MSGGSPIDELVSVWLVPDGVTTETFRAVIDTLATSEEAPRFDPHVTLAVGRVPAGTIEDELRPVLAGHRPLTVAAGPTGHSGDLFRSLFLTLPAQPFVPLRQEVAARLSGQDHHVAPHLSLLYKRLAASRRVELCGAHDYRDRPITFDAVVVVRPGPGHLDLSDIDSWRVSPRLPLGGR
jgi:hypothetical protein